MNSPTSQHCNTAMSFMSTTTGVDMNNKSYWKLIYQRARATPPKDKACSQKRGNVANVRSSRQGAKKLQFLSGCNF